MSSHLESSAPPVTRELAAFAVKAAHEGITERTRREAVRTFVNWLGCAIGGARHPAVDIALDTLAPFAGPAEFTVPGRERQGRPVRRDARHGHLEPRLRLRRHPPQDHHPSGGTGRLGAAAPRRARSASPGGAFLEALIVGIEVECRLGNAVYPAHYDIGWHITGTTGVFGAAAAASRVLGLDARSGDLRARHRGHPVERLSRDVRLHVQELPRRRRREERPLGGPLWRSAGSRARPAASRRPRGFANVMSTERDYDEISRDLGVALGKRAQHLQALRLRHRHPPLDRRRGPDRAGVGRGGRGGGLDRAHGASARPGADGQQGPEDGPAVEVLRLPCGRRRATSIGRAGEHEFSDEVVADPRLVALRDKISASRRARHPRGRGPDGPHHHRTGAGSRSMSSTRSAASQRPMSDEQISAKFMDLATPVIGQSAAERALAGAWAIEKATKLDDLLEAARSGKLRSAAE